MPFDPSFDDIYKLGIKGAVAEFSDMRAERVDEQMYSEGILERIYRQIEASDIVVADMTGQNPNVFYEVGYAHAKGKLCILLTSNANDIPFDLKHRRHIIYNDSIVTLRKELIKDIEWARGELEKQRISHIKVTLQSCYGLLSKTKYSASGEIIFTIDLENISHDRAANIQAIYFYSAKEWTLYQDDKECPSSAVSEPDLIKLGGARRYFVQSPLSCLQKGAWAQISFKACRTLASSFDGEEIKDSYHVRGKGLLRLLTSDGNFDYEIPINVAIEDIPF